MSDFDSHFKIVLVQEHGRDMCYFGNLSTVAFLRGQNNVQESQFGHSLILVFEAAEGNALGRLQGKRARKSMTENFWWIGHI